MKRAFDAKTHKIKGRRLLLPIAVPVFPLNLRCTWAAEVAFGLSRSRLRRLLDRLLRMRCDDHRDLVLCSGVDEAGASCCLDSVKEDCQQVVLDVAGQKRRNRRSPFAIGINRRHATQRQDDGGRRRMTESFWRAKVDLLETPHGTNSQPI